MFDLTTHLSSRRPHYHYVHGLGYHAVTVRGETKHFWTRAEAQEFMFSVGGGEITAPMDPLQALVERYV